MAEYLVSRLGPLGDGVISTESGNIFAPFVLPSEKITGEIMDGRITDPKIVEPTADRIKAACKHFKRCGGCNLQHASDQLLAEWKTKKTKDTLAAVGLAPEFRKIITSPPNSRRRATFTARRTKKSAMVGFLGRASDTITEISECAVSDQSLLSAFDTFKDFAKIGGSRKNSIRISATISNTGLDVQVGDAKELSPTEVALLGQLCAKAKITRLVWNNDLVAMEAPPSQTFDGIEVVPPAGAFLQATKEGEIALINTVKEIVGNANNVVDIFAGCGTFALPLAKEASVSAFEGEKEMIAALDNAWRNSAGLKKVIAEARDLFRRPLMIDELNKFDAVVIDPPRAGAAAQVEELAKSSVPKIAFVSCNPTTFARDAQTLCASDYPLDWVQVVDQFIWNPHVELVAQFTKAK